MKIQVIEKYFKTAYDYKYFHLLQYTKSHLCEPQTSRIIVRSSYTIPMNKLCISVLNRISNDHVTTFQIIYMYALILSDNIFIIIMHIFLAMNFLMPCKILLRKRFLTNIAIFELYHQDIWGIMCKRKQLVCSVRYSI